MLEREFKCPECGESLSVDVSKDKKGKVRMEFFCEGNGDDRFSFEIATGLTNRDVANLVPGKAIKKEMVVKFLERKSDEEEPLTEI